MSRDRQSKKYVILTSWASVSTALLLVVLVGGAFYVADLKIQLEREMKPNMRDTSTSQHKTTQTRQDYQVDEEDQTELIMKKTKDGKIEMIVAIDYKKKISVAYIPTAEECLLRTGVDSEVADDLNILEDEKNTSVKKDTKETTTYTSTGNRVTDMSILPQEMKVYCEGKPTYWAQTVDTDESERQKRRAYDCINTRHCYTQRCSSTTRCYNVCNILPTIN